jgi:hypothetical protein
MDERVGAPFEGHMTRRSRRGGVPAWTPSQLCVGCFVPILLLSGCVMDEHALLQVEWPHWLRQASLDHDENSDQKPSPRQLERRWKHGRNDNALEEWDWLIARSSLPHKTKQRIQKCGTNAWIEYSPSTDRYRLRSDACKHRLCPLCRRRYAVEAEQRLKYALEGIGPGKARLVTLTLRSSDAPLETQLSNLWQAFRRLRSRNYWKHRVRGSVAVLEVTYNAERSQWHPHLHVVTEGRFMAQATLAKEWLHSTRGSSIVDIRLIRSVDATSSYLTSYLTKCPRFQTTTTLDLALEYLTATSRIRLIRTYGTLRRRAQEHERQDEYPSDWRPVKPLLVMLHDALTGSHYALQTLRKVRRDLYGDSS